MRRFNLGCHVMNFFLFTFRCSSPKVFQSHWTLDSKGDLCLHWEANGCERQPEKSHMGDISPPGGKTKQVWSHTFKTKPGLYSFPD